MKLKETIYFTEMINKICVLPFIAFAFAIVFFPKLIMSSMMIDDPNAAEKIFLGRFVWAPTMLNIIPVAYTQSLDLKAYSRGWICRKIYICGSLFLAKISTAVIMFKFYGFSVFSEGKEISLGIYFYCGFPILAGTVWLLMEVNFEYGVYLRQKSMARWNGIRNRFAGRYRVREDDDDFKCISNINN
ncbi:hypothetical protein ACJIZ3_017749 [Penstemon smallii]|uniref:Uncharacterized protein n=1 Tax=Penstemon smallii TaxID=265156 RepID=A0ABD3SWF5_9LAMI